MKHTSKYNEGFRYYVYVRPGQIEYFKTLEDAKSFQQNNDGDIMEMI